MSQQNDYISFVDLRAQHEEIRAEIETTINTIIDNSSFIGGNYVASFENDFADYLGVKEAVAVNSGTDALWLGLIAAGIGPGDAVVTTPNTFIATVEAITRAGATPIFVDIDLATALLDIAALQMFLTNDCFQSEAGQTIHKASQQRVAAIIPVHLYGLPVDMAPLMALAETYNLAVIEDACQAHGARYRTQDGWKRAGSFGMAAAFSFYPAKNLGAMGDGGAVVTNNPSLAQEMRWLRDHGQSEKYIHNTHLGWNSRLDSLQAAVLSLKLKKLDEWNASRRWAADRYREVLASLPLALPPELEYAEQVYHLYVVRAEDREGLRSELHARGVGSGLHYPIPLHLQKAYEDLRLPSGTYPNAERSAETILSLPMHPHMTIEQIERVGQACTEILTSVPEPINI